MNFLDEHPSLIGIVELIAYFFCPLRCIRLHDILMLGETSFSETTPPETMDLPVSFVVSVLFKFIDQLVFARQAWIDDERERVPIVPFHQRY